ncbi:MAG: PD-(D/E)XK nuclease family protein [Burkholderiales bacterium]
MTLSGEPGSIILHAASAAILARERAPNLSGVVVVVPSLYVVQPMQRTLQRAANGVTLLLPTITTLPLWADSVDLRNPPLPDSRRLAWIYSALRRADWFPALDLWQVATEILALIDDCGRNVVALPEDAGDFQRVIRQALRASDNHAVQFEARLVHELWRALQGEGVTIDRHGAYRLRLAELAARADAPLYVVGLADTTAAEQQFLQRYARRQPVHVVGADDTASASSSPLFALLHSAWNDAASAPSLMARATAFREQHGASPAASLRVFAANSLEQEAEAVELTVRRWLFEGKREIAIVAQDRLTARRARARLERAQILIADESGWTLSTTTASSVAMRWLDVIAGDFYFRDLLDFLRSPFILGDIDEAERRAVVEELETLLAGAGYIGGLQKLRAIFERTRLSQAASTFAVSLLASALVFGRKSRTLSSWLRASLESLDRIGATSALRLDAAGIDLLRLLQALAIELEGENEAYSFSEWRRWFDRQLEEASFRDTAIESSVVLTHLGLTDGRTFDGIILLGADADHLPSLAKNNLFNDAVRSQLGLPNREARQNVERRRLMQVLANAGVALITWQAIKRNEPNPPSPFWERLIAFHRVAYGDDLADTELLRLLDALPALLDRQEGIGVAAMPQPSAPNLVPQSLSAYDYGSLIACPYQFFVRRMLALREEEEVLEAMEKKDYGDLVHRILSQFHHRFPFVSASDDAILLAALQEVSEKVFRAAPEGDYFARAWSLRWEKFIPAYLAWQREREGKGWRWQASEVAREYPLELTSGRTVRLRGRLDRIDSRRDESNQEYFAVLDYKTGRGEGLQKRAANPDEDGQLPFYGIIADPAPIELAYVALDNDPVVAHTMTGNTHDIAANHRQRLQRTLNDIAAGKGLPAQGVDAECAYCEAHGVCRKRYWEGSDGD